MSLYLQKLSPEMRFLCACSRVDPTPADIDIQASLVSLVDMERLVARAIRHRVEPLLLRHLRRQGNETCAGSWLDVLEGRVRRNAEKSLRAVRTNIRLAHEMTRLGITFLPLKGVTLAHRYYGQIGLRHSNDIDFWVPEKDVDRVRQLLFSKGARSQSDVGFQEIERGKNHTAFIRRQYCEEAWDTPDGEHLELHWRLTSNAHALRLEPARMTEVGEPIRIASDEFRIMSPVSLLLYLCEHGARHGWYRLKWLFDLPQVIEGNQWNWGVVLDEARRANCLSSLLLGLKLTEILFGWKAPSFVAQAMKARLLLDRQVVYVLHKLHADEKELARPTVMQRMRHLSYRASLAESPKYIWGEVSYYALSHNDLRVLRLPDRWFYVYYPIRPILVWIEIAKHWRARNR